MYPGRQRRQRRCPRPALRRRHGIHRCSGHRRCRRGRPVGAALEGVDTDGPASWTGPTPTRSCTSWAATGCSPTVTSASRFRLGPADLAAAAASSRAHRRVLDDRGPARRPAGRSALLSFDFSERPADYVEYARHAHVAIQSCPVHDVAAAKEQARPAPGPRSAGRRHHAWCWRGRDPRENGCPSAARPRRRRSSTRSAPATPSSPGSWSASSTACRSPSWPARPRATPLPVPVLRRLRLSHGHSLTSAARSTPSRTADWTNDES